MPPRKKTPTRAAQPAVLPQEYGLVSVEELRLHPKNAREGDTGAVFDSISVNGFYGAVLRQRSTGYVLAGNHRLMAAREAGIPSLPCLTVDVDDAAALRILLADNRANDRASYNLAGLTALLQEVVADAGTLDGTLYDTDDLDDLLQQLAGPPPEPEPAAGDGDTPADFLRWGKVRIPLTDADRDALDQLLARYEETNAGSPFGFAAQLTLL